MHKQPGRKPFRRPQTVAKEKEISDRKFRTVINPFGLKVMEIDGIPEPESPLRRHLWKLEQRKREPDRHLVLKTFLEKNGMDEKWRSELHEQGITIAQQELLEAFGHQRTKAISRKDEAEILRKMRLFFAAIEEAKKAGIT